MALDRLPSEQANPATEAIDRAGTEELLSLLNREDRTVPEAVGAEIPNIARAVEAIEQRWRRGGRLVYVGAGTSGRLGALDAAEIPPTFGEDPGRVVALIAGGPEALQRAVEGAEDSTEAGAADLDSIEVGPNDVVVGIAASGRTPYVIGALRRAREVGATTVAVTTNSEAEMLAWADHAVAPAVGPEPITGSTRMKSGTAQKLVLNMLSTALMVRTGHTYGNRMVNVRPTNVKLRERARRLVMEIARCGRDQAEQAVAQTGDVRTAVLMLRLGVDAADAERRLSEAGGVLRRALEQADQAE